MYPPTGCCSHHSCIFAPVTGVLSVRAAIPNSQRSSTRQRRNPSLGYRRDKGQLFSPFCIHMNYKDHDIPLETLSAFPSTNLFTQRIQPSLKYWKSVHFLTMQTSNTLLFLLSFLTAISSQLFDSYFCKSNSPRCINKLSKQSKMWPNPRRIFAIQ